MKKLKQGIFSLYLPLIILLGIGVSLYRSPISIHPDQGKFFFQLHNDSSQGGNSKIFPLPPEEGALYSYGYVLGDALANPYCGLGIYPQDSLRLDLSHYDYFRFALESSVSKGIVFFTFSELEGHTSLGDLETYVPRTTFPVNLEISREVYTLPFRYFTPPSWWLDDQSFSLDNPPNQDWSSILYFGFNSHQDMTTGLEDRMDIISIEITQSPRRFLIPMGGFLVIYYGILLLILWIRKNKQGGTPGLVAYEKLPFTPKGSDETILLHFINKNYSDPLLSIHKVSQETGIPEYRVSKFIKEKFQLSFPAYLNLIRITEAKDLLIKSQEKIINIALQVGFNSSVHFNRIFKSMEQMPPGEFRKRHKGE